MRCEGPKQSRRDGCSSPQRSRTPRSLTTMAREYIRLVRPRVEREAQRFRAMPNLAAVIREAALARREDGKCHGHQRRVGFVRLRAFERALQKRRRRISRCETFDDLYTVIWECRTTRVGRLTVYDTATRIGAYLGLEPERVYLHTGARAGARILGIHASGWSIPMSVIPRAWRQLSPAEVEDCLCIFKRELDQMIANPVVGSTQARCH